MEKQLTDVVILSLDVEIKGGEELHICEYLQDVDLLHLIFDLLCGILLPHLIIEPANDPTQELEYIGGTGHFIVPLVVEDYPDEATDRFEVEDKFCHFYFLEGEDVLYDNHGGHGDLVLADLSDRRDAQFE